jgi:hypothetical protein
MTDRESDVLVGPRFRVEVDDLDTFLYSEKFVRSGSGMTFVVTAPIISGPVVRVDTFDPDKSRYYAKCLNCHMRPGFRQRVGDTMSRIYTRKNELAMRSWAHMHRCIAL